MDRTVKHNPRHLSGAKSARFPKVPGQTAGRLVQFPVSEGRFPRLHCGRIGVCRCHGPEQTGKSILPVAFVITCKSLQLLYFFRQQDIQLADGNPRIGQQLVDQVFHPPGKPPDILLLKNLRIEVEAE